jgi:hypothetical protein
MIPVIHSDLGFASSEPPVTHLRVTESRSPTESAGAQGECPFDNGAPLAGLVRGSAAMLVRPVNGFSTLVNGPKAVFLGEDENSRSPALAAICHRLAGKYITVTNLRLKRLGFDVLSRLASDCLKRRTGVFATRSMFHVKHFVRELWFLNFKMY